MATVFDVAEYILRKTGPMSAMKLQKLVYYAQAWSLVWDDRPIFQNRIEAWANGPVVRDLYDVHKGRYQLAPGELIRNSDPQLTQEQRETIDTVLAAYGSKSAQWLSDQTHSEDPWLRARDGLEDGERGSREITLESLLEFYSSLR